MAEKILTAGPVVFIAVLMSLLTAGLIYRFGARLSLIDAPNERSSHKLPMPRGGGLGIWLGFILTGMFFINGKDFILMAGLAGLLGLAEDRFSLSPRLRLLLQGVLSVSVAGLFSGLPGTAVAAAFFLFWIIFIAGTTNFFNFMDGINGIAALTALIAFGFTAFFSHYEAGEPGIALMSIGLSAGSLGFLPFNFPKAKVFMGDTGSIFLGFLFASFVMRLTSNISGFICLIMFLSTFYADAIVTIYYRLRRGENLLKAHRSHLYQYMSNELGMPHWKVSVLYAAVQLVAGFLSVWAYRKNIGVQVVLAAAYGIIFIVIYKSVKAIKPVKIKSAA